MEIRVVGPRRRGTVQRRPRAGPLRTRRYGTAMAGMKSLFEGRLAGREPHPPGGHVATRDTEPPSCRHVQCVTEPVAKGVQHGNQRGLLRQRQHAFGEPRQVPQHRLRLTAIGVQAGVVEVRGRERRVVCRQKAPGAVIEALTGDVDVVRVQHAVHEAGGHVLRRQPGYALHNGVEKGNSLRARIVALRLGQVIRNAVVQQAADVVRLTPGGQALKRADADMAVIEPHQHSRPGRRWLVPTGQSLAGLDQRKTAAGVDAQRLQHRRRQYFAHAALQRQPPVTAAGPGGLTAAFGTQVQQTAALVP